MITTSDDYLSMQDTLDLVRQSVEQQLRRFAMAAAFNPEPADLRAMVESFILLTENIRFGALSDNFEIAQIWNTVRENDAVLDCIVEGLSDFYAHFATTPGLRYQEGEGAWDTLVTVMASTVVVARAMPTDESLADDDFVHRAFSSAAWYTIFSNNTWLLYIYLIKLCGLTTEELLKLLLPPKTRGSTRGNANDSPNPANPR